MNVLLHHVTEWDLQSVGYSHISEQGMWISITDGAGTEILIIF
jgi:hypothetical protein